MNKNNIKSIFFTSFLALFTFPFLSAQNTLTVEVKPSDLPESAVSFHDLTQFDLYELDGQAIYDFAQKHQFQSFVLHLKIDETRDWEMELEASKVHGDDYKFTMSSGEEMEVEKNITYKGFLKSNPEAKVRMTISENLIQGVIFDEEIHAFETTERENGRTKNDLTVIYKMSKSNSESGGCGHLHIPNPTQKMPPSKSNNPVQNLDIPKTGGDLSENSSNNTYCPKLGVTLDWQGLNHAGSVANFNADLQSYLNILNSYHDNEFSVEFELTPVHVISSAPNPWADNSCCNGEYNMYNYKDWAKNNFPHPFTATILFTGQNFNGIGWGMINTMCTNIAAGQIDYLYSQSVSQKANILTHEIGHIWGCQHGSTSSQYIMSPSIWGGTLQWTSTSTNVINNKITALSGCLPTCGSGTDNDGDGYDSTVDCDDNNAAVNPGATEVCDGIDNDCDGQIDEGCGSYCTPIHTGSENELITNVSVGTINNSTGGWNSNITGYSDYVHISTQVDIGTNYTITVTPNYSWNDSKMGIWADWNQNFVFDSGEQIASLSGVGPWTASFTPPANAVLGATRLRIRLQYGASYTPAPCAGTWHYSGETEDYTLTVAGCTINTYYADLDGDGFGDSNNSTSACSAPSGYVLDNTDCNDTNFDVSPIAAEVCDGIDNNCNGQIDEGCGGGSYCTPIHNFTEHELITNVTVGTINNSTGGWNTNITGYSDYVHISTQVEVGSSYAITVTPNFSFPDSKVGIWADWNQDFVFQSNENIASFSGVGPWTANITPPSNAVAGTTRLRVRLQYGPNYVPDPCAGAYNSGETEDYSLVVVNCTTVDDHDFEPNWGIWNDGGSDARRNINDAPFANSGNYCVRLRDNTSTSVMTTDNLDLSAYSEITVSFSYLVESFENTEDFWLQISTDGGATFTTVEDWVRTIDFQNGERHNPTVTVNGPFSSTTKIRFRCDASGNGDKVYIDDVVISGCGTSGGNNIIIQDDEYFEEVETVELTIEEEKEQSELHVFPNPVSTELTIEYRTFNNAKSSIELYNLTGQKVLSKQIEVSAGLNVIQLNIQELPKGMYLLNIREADVNLTRQIVIGR
jgi:hypothetical protein